MNKQIIIQELEKICHKTGAFIRSNFGQVNNTQIESKAENSLVSFVDKKAEKQITDGLHRIFPQASFLTEENMVINSEDEYQWIVDPLDGTTNFLYGIPHFSISIALKHHDEVVLGVVYDVMQEDFYSAIKDQGAYLNHGRIQVNGPKPLKECIIATGFPYNKELISENHFSILNHFLKNARALRRLGSAALDLCYVARGSFDLYYENNLNAWDLAAGALIVEEAGGSICDFKGGNEILSSGSIISNTPSLKKEANGIVTLLR